MQESQLLYLLMTLSISQPHPSPQPPEQQFTRQTTSAELLQRCAANDKNPLQHDSHACAGTARQPVQTVSK
jgi:hypothetical protein